MENQIVENPVASQVQKEKTFNPLTVSRVYESQYQKEGTITAELKMVVTTKSIYPAKRVANSLQDNIFALDDFDFKNQEYINEETRVGWIDVPVGATVESVVEQLKNFPNAKLYRILSNKPILADSDRYAISNSELEATLDGYAESQVVRYPKGHEKEGQITLDPNGKFQYRRVAFSAAGKDDVDARNSNAEDFYASEALKAELAEMNQESTNFTPIEGQHLDS